MNKELGRRVLDHVTAHREQFDMGCWAEPDPDCGTVACLAGWAMLLSGYRSLNTCAGDWGFIRPDGTRIASNFGDEARELLGLTHADCNGDDNDEYTLFGDPSEDRAIERFRALVEAAEAAS